MRGRRDLTEEGNSATPGRHKRENRGRAAPPQREIAKLLCYSLAFRETLRTMQTVECSLLHLRARGRVSSQPRTPTSFCENLKCIAQAHIPKFLKSSLESVKGRYNQVTAMIHKQKGQLFIHYCLHQWVP